jgi:hypothetical protein
MWGTDRGVVKGKITKLKEVQEGGKKLPFLSP